MLPKTDGIGKTDQKIQKIIDACIKPGAGFLFEKEKGTYMVIKVSFLDSGLKALVKTLTIKTRKEKRWFS